MRNGRQSEKLEENFEHCVTINRNLSCVQRVSIALDKSMKMKLMKQRSQRKREDFFF